MDTRFSDLDHAEKGTAMFTWDARKISDRAYHRRVFALACFGIVSGLIVLAGAGIGLSEGFSFRDAFFAAFALAIVAYFGRRAVLENQRIK